MESFAQIDNPLIMLVDKTAILEPPVPKSLKNTLKTLVSTRPSSFLGTPGTIYSKKMIFSIPRRYNGLAQMYIKCTLSTGSVASDVESDFSTKIFKQIELKSRNQVTLQTITPQYTLARLDAVQETSLYTRIVTGVEPDVPFSDPVVTVFVPLFFFFSTSLNSFLATRYLEDLELECTVNDTAGSMGMSESLTSAEYELFMLFHDTNDSTAAADKSYTIKPQLPKQLHCSYDIFREDNVTALTGTTSARLLLRCNKAAFNLNVCLVDANSNRAQVKTMKLTVGGVEFVNLDFRINYQMYSDEVTFLENGTTTYWFSKEKSRENYSGLMNFSEHMFPCYLDITFDALPADYIMHTFEEVKTLFEVSNTGVVKIGNPQGQLDQLNSSMEAAHLVGT